MQLILLSFDQQPRIYFVSLPTGGKRKRERERICVRVCHWVSRKASLSIVSPGRLPETDLGTTAHLYVCNCVNPCV